MITFNSPLFSFRQYYYRSLTWDVSVTCESCLSSGISLMAGVVSKITTAEDKVGGMGMPFRITLVSAPGASTYTPIRTFCSGWLAGPRWGGSE